MKAVWAIKVMKKAVKALVKAIKTKIKVIKVIVKAMINNRGSPNKSGGGGSSGSGGGFQNTFYRKPWEKDRKKDKKEKEIFIKLIYVVVIGVQAHQKSAAQTYAS